MKDLIAMLEAAGEGSRELDGEIALLVGATIDRDRFMRHPPWWELEGFPSRTTPWPFTASLDAIVALIERKLPEQFAGLQANRHPDRRADWSAWLEDGMEQHEARAETPALALCIALLRALSTGESET